MSGPAGHDPRNSLESRALAVLITRAISAQPTCLLCIVDKVDANQATVVRLLARIAETIQVIIEADGSLCGTCGSTWAPVYSTRRRA